MLYVLCMYAAFKERTLLNSAHVWHYHSLEQPMNVRLKVCSSKRLEAAIYASGLTVCSLRILFR